MQGSEGMWTTGMSVLGLLQRKQLIRHFFKHMLLPQLSFDTIVVSLNICTFHLRTSKLIFIKISHLEYNRLYTIYCGRN